MRLGKSIGENNRAELMKVKCILQKYEDFRFAIRHFGKINAHYDFVMELALGRILIVILKIVSFCISINIFNIACKTHISLWCIIVVILMIYFKIRTNKKYNKEGRKDVIISTWRNKSSGYNYFLYCLDTILWGMVFFCVLLFECAILNKIVFKL